MPTLPPVNLLASAIPGLREIRGPLVAGYLWLICAWLIVDPRVPLSESTTGPIRSLVDLADTAGPVATAAGVSVGAYLMGVVSMGITDSLRAAVFSQLAPVDLGPISISFSVDNAIHELDEKTNTPQDAAEPRAAGADGERRPPNAAARPSRGGRRLDRFVARLIGVIFPDTVPMASAPLAAPSEPIDDRLDQALRLLPRVPGEEQTRDRLRRVWPGLSKAEQNGLIELCLRTRRDFNAELELPATLIVGEKAPQAFGETDRARAEGTFRLTVALPLAALVLVLMIRGTWLWAPALIGPAALTVQGLRRVHESQTLIRQTFEHGGAPSPAMENFAAYVRSLGERVPEPSAR